MLLTMIFITHFINITTFFKVILSGNFSRVSTDILVSSNFSMPIISSYNRQPSSIFFLHFLQSIQLTHDTVDLRFLSIYCENIY